MMMRNPQHVVILRYLLLLLAIFVSLRLLISSMNLVLPDTSHADFMQTQPQKTLVSAKKPVMDDDVLFQKDDLRIGRSCRYVPPNSRYRYTWIWKFLVRYSYRFRIEYWECQKCSMTADVTIASASSPPPSCRKLSRRHWCQAFPSEPWDSFQPRVASMQAEAESSTLAFGLSITPRTQR